MSPATHIVANVCVYNLVGIYLAMNAGKAEIQEMALVDKVWDGNYSAAVCVSILSDVYYYKGFVSWEVFE